MMILRGLGQSGLEASAVAFGAWALGGWMWGGVEQNDPVRALHAALDNGINFIDTAPAYGMGRSEEVVGQAIHDRRDRVVLATKVGLVWNIEKGERFFQTIDPVDRKKYVVHRYLGPESIRYEVEQSLKRLQTDYIDLYQTHWQDPNTPIGETMVELLRLKEEGKIRAIGVSNCTPDQIDTYREVGPVDSDQEQYSMISPGAEDELLPYCESNGLAFLAYSPIGQGLLTGKVGPERTFPMSDQRSNKKEFSVENRKRVMQMLQAFRPVTDRHDCTLTQLAIAWTIHRPGCSHALVGARNATQAAENAGAAAIRLSDEDQQLMNSVIEEYRVKAATD
jgi:methylglyoxal reductase